MGNGGPRQWMPTSNVNATRLTSDERNVVESGTCRSRTPFHSVKRRIRGAKSVPATNGRPQVIEKKWSGRPDSNPRRPAWEIDCRLKIQNLASTVSTEGDDKYPVINGLLQVPVNGAQMEHR